MADTTTTRPLTIAEQVAAFNVGFNAEIGPVIAAAFVSEQAGLTAAGIADTAVQIGDSVSDALLVTVSGASTTLAEAMDGRPAVIVFYRGAWCPYCNLTLAAYQRALYPALLWRDVKLLAISPQTPDGSSRMAKNGNLEFPVLSDVGNLLAWQLGILTEPSPAAIESHTKLGFAVADSNADGTPAVPFPTVLVLDTDRTVRFVDIQVDYTKRTEVDDIVAAVDELVTTKKRR